MGTITRQEATAKADAIYADYKKSGISPWSRRMDKPRDVSRIASEEKREFYVKKYEDQEGKCAICGDVCPHLFIDHCHRTGKLRALLCSRCNTAIGQLRDDPAIIRKAADYIDHFNHGLDTGPRKWRTVCESRNRPNRKSFV